METTQNRYEIGQRIRNFRISKQLTQSQFAESLDVSTNYISEIENGKKRMSQDILCKLCLLYQLSADYILFGKNRTDLSDYSLYELVSSIPTDMIPTVIEYLESSLKLKSIESTDKMSLQQK